MLWLEPRACASMKQKQVNTVRRVGRGTERKEREGERPNCPLKPPKHLDWGGTAEKGVVRWLPGCSGPILFGSPGSLACSSSALPVLPPFCVFSALALPPSLPPSHPPPLPPSFPSLPFPLSHSLFLFPFFFSFLPSYSLLPILLVRVQNGPGYSKWLFRSWPRSPLWLFLFYGRFGFGLRW